MAAMRTAPSWMAMLGGLGLAALLAAGPDPAAAQNGRRVLLVLARRADEPKVAAQRQELHRLGADGDDRGLDMVVAAARQPGVLGRRGDFEAVLIGKDGGVKTRSARVISAASLRLIIDAMPMGRAEAARRHTPAARP